MKVQELTYPKRPKSGAMVQELNYLARWMVQELTHSWFRS